MAESSIPSPLTSRPYDTGQSTLFLLTEQETERAGLNEDFLVVPTEMPFVMPVSSQTKKAAQKTAVLLPEVFPAKQKMKVHFRF